MSELKSQTEVCNATWHARTMARFCADEETFARATLGELRAAQRWPSATEQDRGLATLWYNSVNMRKHGPALQQKAGHPFFLYVLNAQNTTAGMSVVHARLSA